jgi:hypothetical protein
VPSPFGVLVSLGVFFGLLRLIGLAGFPLALAVLFCKGFSGSWMFGVWESGGRIWFVVGGVLLFPWSGFALLMLCSLFSLFFSIAILLSFSLSYSSSSCSSSSWSLSSSSSSSSLKSVRSEKSEAISGGFSQYSLNAGPRPGAFWPPPSSGWLEASSVIFAAEDLPFGGCFVALSSSFQEVEVEEGRDEVGRVVISLED